MGVSGKKPTRSIRCEKCYKLFITARATPESAFKPGLASLASPTFNFCFASSLIENTTPRSGRLMDRAGGIEKAISFA